jgi:hypothetical protein
MIMPLSLKPERRLTGAVPLEFGFGAIFSRAFEIHLGIVLKRVYHAPIATCVSGDIEMSLQVDLISELAKLSLKSIHVPIFGSDKDQLDVREVQLKLLQDLTVAGIEPALFDLMLSSELDRNLKKQFGIAFFIATIVFTTASYGVIVFNAVYHWGISDVAVTALIVETPIQFIGLLYIIARNLFPQRQLPASVHASAKPKTAKCSRPAVAQSLPQQAPQVS